MRLSDILAALPFPDAICAGIISGVSLARLLDYSISNAYFNETSNNEADRLLQVSGMHITYNSMIPQGKSRLVAVEILENKVGKYKPRQPMKLYKFSTIDFLCVDYGPFPTLLGAYGSFTV